MSFKLKLKKKAKEVQEEYCDSCGQYGHNFRDCGAGKTCYKCGKTGHNGRDCPDPPIAPSVAVMSAIEQGMYKPEQALWGENRKETGNESITDWRVRAEADRAKTDADKDERDPLTDMKSAAEYDFVLPPEEQARREKKMMKKRKREEEEARKKKEEEERKKAKAERAAGKGVTFDDSIPNLPPAPSTPVTGTKCEGCEAMIPDDANFCAKCGRPKETSLEAQKRREEERKAQRELERLQLREQKLEEERKARLKANLQSAKYKDKRLQKKMIVQGAHFAPPEWASCRTDKKLILSVEKDGAKLETWDITSHPYYLIGKNHEVVDFKLDHPSISRVHLAIVHDEERKATFVKDLGSAWGTKVNGSKIPKEELTEIDVDSEITLGGSSRIIRVKERSIWE